MLDLRKNWKKQEACNVDTIAQAVREFRNRIVETSITPEGFFRMLDINYEQMVITEDFAKKLRQMNLGLSEKAIHFLKLIFDEDQNGTIDFREYLQALDIYNCRCEEIAQYNDKQRRKDQNQALITFYGVFQMKQMEHQEFFNFIDTENNGSISMEDVEKTIKTLAGYGVNFKIKDMHQIHSFLDLDSNGSVTNSEFTTQMKRLKKLYDREGPKK